MYSIHKTKVLLCMVDLIFGLFFINEYVYCCDGNATVGLNRQKAYRQISSYFNYILFNVHIFKYENNFLQ